MIKGGQTIALDFVVVNSSQALANADATPAGTLVVNGTDNAAAVTVTNKATGIYTASVTLPSLSLGDQVQLRVTATVGGVATGGIIWQDSVAPDALSTLDAAGVRSAVGLATANLDTQLGTIAGYIDTEVAAIKSKTDQLTTFDFVTAGTRFLTMIEQDGAVYRYSANAIELAPGASLTVSDIVSALSGQDITITSPVLSTGEVEIVQGTDYLTADSRQLDFVVSNYTGPSMTGATPTLELYTSKGVDRALVSPDHTFTGTTLVSGTTVTHRFSLTRAQTDALQRRVWHYYLFATTAGGSVIPVSVDQPFEVV